MLLSAAARVVALTCTGLLAGIFLGHRAGPQHALHALSGSSFVQFQQLVHVQYVRFMPPLTSAALLAAVVWLVSARSTWRSPEFGLVAASAVAILSVAVLTRTISVPLNELLMTWTVAEPPHDLRAIWAPWERVNTARAWLAGAALLMEALALSLRALRA